MAAPALDRSSRPSLPDPPQMAVLALAMVGVLQINFASSSHHRMTGSAGFYRLSLAPAVTPADIIMMALGAGNPGGGVAVMAENHRRLPPGLKNLIINDGQGSRFNRFGFAGRSEAKPGGQQKSQSEPAAPGHPGIRAKNRRRWWYPIPIPPPE